MFWLKHHIKCFVQNITCRNCLSSHILNTDTPRLHALFYNVHRDLPVIGIVYLSTKYYYYSKLQSPVCRYWNFHLRYLHGYHIDITDGRKIQKWGSPMMVTRIFMQIVFLKTIFRAHKYRDTRTWYHSIHIFSMESRLKPDWWTNQRRS